MVRLGFINIFWNSAGKRQDLTLSCWNKFKQVPFFSIGIFCLVLLSPQVSSKLAHLPFRMLNIGGEVTKTFFVMNEHKKYYPDIIFENKFKSYCVTSELNLLLDIAGKKYVQMKDADGIILQFELDSKNLKEYSQKL